MTRPLNRIALLALLAALLSVAPSAQASVARDWRPLLERPDLQDLPLRVDLDGPGLLEQLWRGGGAPLDQAHDRVPKYTAQALIGTPFAADSDLNCLSLLSAENVSYTLADRTEGIATPIRIPSDTIGGVRYRYYYQGQPPRVFDCRLALALARAAPVLRANGVTEVIYLSHYRPSFGLLPKGGYHYHAQGLAIDVKGFRVGKGVVIDIARDYERGLGEQEPQSCLGRPMTRRGMLLRQIVCDLDEADAFFAILTPDYDEAHWHHFHLSAFHPAQRSRLRPKQTALMEVPMEALPPWALSRSLHQRPERRTWDAVAARPWPKHYEGVRTAFGIPAAPTAAEDAAALLDDTGPLTDVSRAVSSVLQRIPDDWLELLHQATADHAPLP